MEVGAPGGRMLEKRRFTLLASARPARRVQARSDAGPGSLAPTAFSAGPARLLRRSQRGEGGAGLWAISQRRGAAAPRQRWRARTGLWHNDRLYSDGGRPLSLLRPRLGSRRKPLLRPSPGAGARQTIQNQEFNQVAVKIRLKRMGKKFAPFYRVVVVDGRKKRDGRVIEEIGVYDPMQEPSLIRIDSERAQYWLGVGAQPSNTVFNLLKITGDYHAFKGLPIPEGKLKVKDEQAAAALKEAAVRAAADDAEKHKAAAAKAAADKEAAEAASAPAEEGGEAPAEEA